MARRVWGGVGTIQVVPADPTIQLVDLEIIPVTDDSSQIIIKQGKRCLVNLATNNAQTVEEIAAYSNVQRILILLSVALMRQLRAKIHLGYQEVEVMLQLPSAQASDELLQFLRGGS